MKNKKTLKILAVLAFIFVIMLGTFTLADVGDFNSFDSGSDWGSSDWGSSSWDYDSDYSYSGSGGGSGFIGFIIFVVIVVIIVLANKNNKGGGTPTGGNTTNIGYRNSNAINNLKQNDSNFSEEKFLIWAKDLFIKMQYAWSNRNFEEIRPYETKELFEQHNTQISRYINSNRINVMERVSVDDAQIVNYESDGSKETLTVYLSAKMKDYIIDSTTQKLLEGNKETYWRRKYKLTFVRKLGAKTQVGDGLSTTNCPNCGAPTEVTSSGKCKYCGAVIVTDNHDEWVLSSLEPIK